MSLFEIKTYFIPERYFGTSPPKARYSKAIVRERLPVEVGRKLSHGVFGAVFQSNTPGRVWKFSFPVRDSGYIAFVTELSKLTRQNAYLPTIYSATLYVYADTEILAVEMEQLHKMPRPYWRTNRNKLNPRSDPNDWKRILVPSNEYAHIVDFFNMAEKVERLDNWFLRGDKELQFAAKFVKETARKHGCQNTDWDIHSGNIMFRSDGTPVLIDPFRYSEYDVQI